MRSTVRVFAVVAAGIVNLLSGCPSQEVRGLGWEIRFADEASRVRAVAVEARIIEGGCRGSVVRYRQVARRGSMPDGPPRLDPGTYGMSAQASDGDCIVFAADCVEVELPRASGATISIVMNALESEIANCDSERCEQGICSSGSDGGRPDGSLDASVPVDAPPAQCTSDAQCGECEVCGSNGTCRAGREGDACSSGLCRAGMCCAGCWDGTRCEPGGQANACGSGGATCSMCSAPTPICNGSCVEGTKALAIGAAGRTACAISEDGRLFCWGENNYGQLGSGTAGEGAFNGTPTRVGVESNWTSIDGGRSHLCGTRGTGLLECWGFNDDGQLGTGDETNRVVPTATLPNGATYRLVSAGADRTLAVHSDGTLWGTGENAGGQLATGDTESRAMFVPVSSTVFTQLANGTYGVCAIDTGGALYVWGSNYYGGLANGTSGPFEPSALAPRRIGMESDWTAVGYGEGHACAIRAGQLYCWGRNADGQVGNGSTTLRTSPTRIGTDVNWSKVVGGLAHTCGLRTDGTIWCWGRNDFGQIGNGTASTTDVTTPRRVPGEGWDQLTAGLNFVCARRTSGSIACWGANTVGQLGQGDAADRSTPVDVLLPP